MKRKSDSKKRQMPKFIWLNVGKNEIERSIILDYISIDNLGQFVRTKTKAVVWFKYFQIIGECSYRISIIALQFCLGIVLGIHNNFPVYNTWLESTLSRAKNGIYNPTYNKTLVSFIANVSSGSE